MSPFACISGLPGYRHLALAGGSTRIAFQERGGCALALGEPEGPESARTTAIREFVILAREHGLRPAFVPVAREVFARAGLRTVPIGQTARLDLAAFSLSGSDRRGLRQSVRRAERGRLRFAVWEEPGGDRLERLAACSAAWLAPRRLPERRFGSGRFEAGYVGRSTVGVILGGDDRVEAFATLIEGHAPDEKALDLMRRRPDAIPGAMDLLISRWAERLRAQGFAGLDLGLAPLTGLGASLVERLLAVVARAGNRYYGFTGLFRFKNKFRPDWTPSFLAYASPASLPRILLAVAETGHRLAAQPAMRSTASTTSLQ